MNLILNTNELGYKPFLSSPINVFVMGLKNFCINQKYVISLKKLNEVIEEIKASNKQIYLSLNLFAKEGKIKKIASIISKLKDLNIDGFIVSDLGILNMFKQHNLESKVILNLQTYVTNKYSAKSLIDLGIKGLYVSKEITLEDIKEISNFNKNKIYVLGQGYVPITHSYRSILKCYYSKHKLKRNSNLHYIKEESRDNYYHLTEDNSTLTVFNDKQYSLFPYLVDLTNNNVTNFEINANLLNLDEIKDYISFFDKGLGYIKTNSLEEFNKLKEEFIQKHEFSNPFLHTESFLLKEGN